MSDISEPKAPLFRDPIYDGAADPTIIWNHEEKSWWMLYTSRRANQDTPYVAFGHGTDIGIASSKDGGYWLYRGTLQGLEFERGRNSFWAPEVIWHDRMYHMYVSYVPGVPSDWEATRDIVHMTSENLWDWKFESRLPLSSNRVIDACVHRLPNGRWRLWYKDEVNVSHTYAADSDDLYNWEVVGPIITDCKHEGPNVFQWRGSYWMITDAWCGLGVYKSEDMENWTRQDDNILAEPGTRTDDGAIGQHADVLVQGDEAYVFYFTHPQSDHSLEGPVHNVIPYPRRRSSLQVARLELEGGKMVCYRDKPFHFQLKPGE